MQPPLAEAVPMPAVAPSPGGAAVGILDAMRALRHSGSVLLDHAALHGRLALVEWAEERDRLLRMALVLLLGFACLLAVMLFAGALVLTLSWETAYRVPIACGLVAGYTVGLLLAWRRFKVLSSHGEHSFAASREELAADLALLRRR